MLLSFVCPATTPLWMILIGDFFAIVVVKQLFGGIGKNFLNPALAGRAALLASYAGAMTSWLPAGTKAAIGGGMPADVVSAATPLAYLKTGDVEGLKQIASVGDMFLGKIGGSMGEISALMLLIGGLYLLCRKVISWQTPVAYIATVAVLTLLFPKAGSGVGVDALQHFRRRSDPGRLLHGHRLRHLSRHQEGPADLRHRLRPVHRVYPLLRLLQRGRLLLHHGDELLHRSDRQVHQARSFRRGEIRQEGGGREMSNEVKTKEKIDMDPKYIIKLTVTLLLTCMVVAGLLGWVNSITKDKIAAITWAEDRSCHEGGHPCR